ncbi:MAG TPA: N-acetyltransferase [Burkholderiales bacterium]|nr:N-acetyltransferase [Burkholderiales bacterium]
MALVRAEEPRDAEAVHALLRAAFAREAEARLVERLRASGKILCTLVAEDAGRILGHAVFSRAAACDGVEGQGAAVLAPVAVLPAFQRLGIGSALVSAGIGRCRLEREPRLLVLGDPAWYARFGFLPAARFGLRCPWPAPAANFMAMELQPGAFAGATGAVRYGHEFDDLE